MRELFFWRGLTFWLLVLLQWYCIAAPAELPTPTAAAPFRIEQRDARWWLVTPEGKTFFSLGMCVLTQGASRESFDPENPGYAAWRCYPSPELWADTALRRLKRWNFTTVGGWSDFATLGRSPGQTFYLTPVLHIGSTAGAPWWDMWDAAVIERMDTVAREQILSLRDDPRLLGYYSDNELGWWNATLWKMTLEQPPASGQRQRLIHLLREIYRDDWNKLREDFDSEKVSDWETLQQGGMLYVRSGSQGFKAMRKFLAMIAERYYQLVHDLIRKYDQRALILGDRYQSFYYPEVARAASRWIDAVSSNLNASWNDGSYLRFYLATLHQLTGKPILISEFYAAAEQNRSGNRNTQGVFPVVRSQKERAFLLNHTLELLTREPYVLGADWFQYFDEPRHGREDGENYNFGLVDINDVPYEEVTSAFSRFDGTQMKAQANSSIRLTSGLPPAPKAPLGHFEPMLALKEWDRNRGFIPPTSPNPLADLYMCWDRHTLYLGLYAMDITEDAYYRDRSVPKVDRALWQVQINGGEPIRIRLGAGRDPIANLTDVRIAHLSGLNLTVRSITAIALSASQLGRNSFRAGDKVELQSSFATHGNCYQMEWNGVYVLSK